MYDFEFIKGHISDVVNSRGLKLTYGVQTWEENIIRGDEYETWYNNDDILILYYYKGDYLYVEGLLSWDFNTLYNMFPPNFEVIHKDEMYFMESHDINRVISIMNSYFTEHNNKDILIDDLMKHSNNNPYVKDYILQMRNNHEITALCCNIISAMVCYMNGEFTRDQLFRSIMNTTHNNKDVKEHLEIIL